jgi:hypothetical protein
MPTKRKPQSRSNHSTPDPKPPREVPNEIIAWLLTLSYWKALFGLVVLIFAWRIAHHFFP